VDWNFGRLARYVAALTAFGLGALYAVGAFLETTELRGAHFEAKDVLPLIPVQQLLARGIATVILSTFLAGIVLAGFAVGRASASTGGWRRP
jgi:hypothetical protein